MDFSDIALAKLLQTVPELGPYILTFKDVSDELQDETGIQVGVFVLRSGSELSYIPVVGKNDNVYPIDSIYFDSKKRFFPLTKKTVTAVTAPSQLEQGKATNIPKTVVGNPSVYELINPPRTGKYVYASTSRLVDFLSSLPQHVKQATVTQISQEKSVYDALDKMYSLKAIFDVLKQKPQSLAAKTNEVPISVVTEANPNMSSGQISSILNDGYHISGEQPTNRVAVSVLDFSRSGTFKNITSLDGDRDYEVMLTNGTAREAFVPKLYTVGTSPRGVSGLRDETNPKNALAIFTNGDYALRDSFVAAGESLDRNNVLTSMFEYRPPVMLKDVYNGDSVVIMLNDGSFIGPIDVSSIVMNSYGVEVSGTNRLAGYSRTNIFAYRNFAGSVEVCGRDIYIPFNSIVMKLGKNITSELEVNINSASHKRHMNEIQMLGDEMNIGYDGVEFSVNGRAVGGEPKVMEILVVNEGLDPSAATNFVKQAKETKFTKIYMTKRAGKGFTTEFSSGDIPSYGALNDDSEDVTMNGAYKPNGNFIPNVQESLKAGDAQVTEATIISELLQAPDMFEVIEEYLPDIEEAIDKLGRTLFMARIHVNKLAESTDADSVYAFLASLKNVYRLLGENYMKLQEYVAVNDALGGKKAPKPIIE
ncbi:hypothetical protein D3C87_279990 [compost metagenome]